MVESYWVSSLAIGFGGFVGANFRYLIAQWLPKRLPAGIGAEYATFFVNFTGSLLLAWFLARVARSTAVNEQARLFIAVGFFGSYTTFSTFANEFVALGRIDGGNWTQAVVYLLVTNVTCVLGVLLGLWLGNRL